MFFSIVQLGQIETVLALSDWVQVSWSGTLAVATFQEGVSSYTGTQDTYLDESNASSSAAGGYSSIAVDLDHTGGLEAQGLIRFDAIFGNGAGQIPLGSTINSATLTIEAIDPSSAGAAITLHKMLANWDESSSWNSMGSGLQSGSEYTASATSTLPSPETTGSKVFAGLAADLQSWSSGGTNYGWAILSDIDNGWDMNSSEHGTSSLRPLLTVDYSAPPLSGTIADDLASNDFTGNSGTVNWSGDWIEVDGTVGAGGGNVQVTGGELVLSGPPTSADGPSAAREADLSGATYASLSFDYRTGSGVEAGDPDRVVLEISNNGGSTWNTLENFDTFTGATSGSRSYDISAYIAADTQVRFRGDNGYGGTSSSTSTTCRSITTATR